MTQVKDKLNNTLLDHGFGVDENDDVFAVVSDAAIPFADLRAAVYENDRHNSNVEVGRRIVSAANRNTETGEVIMGVRHFCTLMHQQLDVIEAREPGSKRSKGWLQADQGFVDNRGVYLSRREAWKVAEAAGQIIRRTGEEGVLYSEDLH